jgi:hypothetical protein
MQGYHRFHPPLGALPLQGGDNSIITRYPAACGGELHWLAAPDAEIGANAAVLVADRTMRVGAVVMGSWYSRQAMLEFRRVVVAVAIRDRK